MGTIFAGNSDDVSWPSTPKSITGITNATPMVVTTSTPHGLRTDNYVEISGVVGLDNADGGWTINVLSSTTFALKGSSASAGAYESGGSVVSYALPAFLMVDDGDPASAANFNAPSVGLGNSAQWLAKQVRRLDLQDQALDERVDSLDGAVDARLDALEPRATALEGRATALETQDKLSAILNFRPKQSLTASTCAAYDAANRRWYVAGNDASVRSSKDFALDFDGDELSIGTSEDATGIAVDSSGNVVVALNVSKVFEKTIGTDVWTSVSLPTACGFARVAFDPIRSLWCLVGNDLNLTRIFTSTNRTTWTQRTPSTTLGTDYWARHDIAVRPSNGRLVMAAAYNGGTSIQVASSDDGGITWTDRASLPLTSLPDDLAITYDTGAGIFMIVSTDNSPIKSEVWTSPDGATWTKKATLTNSRIYRPACIRGVWLTISLRAMNQYNGPHHELAYSTDNGATWLPTGMRIDGPAVGVFGLPDGAGALVVTPSYVWHSARIGAPSYPALT